MILEVAILNVKSGQIAAFEKAMREAKPLIAATRVFKVLRSDPAWRPKAAMCCWLDGTPWRHIRSVFAQSARYQEWRNKLHHFYEPFPTVQHYGPSI